MLEQELKELYNNIGFSSLYHISHATFHKASLNYFHYKIYNLQLDFYQALIDRILLPYQINPIPNISYEKFSYLLQGVFLEAVTESNHTPSPNYVYLTIEFEDNLENIEQEQWLQLINILETQTEGIMWVNPFHKILNNLNDYHKFHSLDFIKNKLWLKSDVNVYHNLRTTSKHLCYKLQELNINITKISFTRDLGHRFRFFYVFYGYDSQASLAEAMGKKPSYFAKTLDPRSPTKKPNTNTRQLMATALTTKIYLGTREADKTTLYNFYLEEIDRVFAQPPDDVETTQPNQQEESMPTNTTQTNNLQYIKWNLNVDSEIANLKPDELNKKIAAIMDILETLGDGMILVNNYSQETLNLFLESSREVFNRLKALHQSGYLQELLKENNVTLTEEPPVNLSRWFNNLFTSLWQPVNELLTPQQLLQPVYAMTIERAKIIDLTVDDTCVVILMVRIAREKNLDSMVEVKVFPSDPSSLPSDLTMTILDEQNQTLAEIFTIDKQPSIEHKFWCNRSSAFQVIVSTEDASVTEDFIV